MNKKRKFIFAISVLAICPALFFFGLMIISDAPYRNKLPEYPEFQGISKQLKSQISDAGFKAYLNPTIGNLGELGMIYHSGGYAEKAAVCYQLAARRNSKEKKRRWIWSYYLGYLNLEQGESKSAIENFRYVVEKNPKNTQALFYIGEAYQNLGLVTNAEYIFKRITGLSEMDSEIRKSSGELYFPIQVYAGFHLAQIYLNTNRPDTAEMVLHEILQKEWTFGPAYKLLGDVYTKQGNQDLAEKNITRSNDLAQYTPPTDTLLDKIAMISRSEQYILKQIEVAKRSYNFNKELQMCKQALKYIPENKSLLSDAISANFILGRNQEVIPFLDRHFKYSSDDFEELLRFTDLLNSKGFEKQANKYFEQAKTLQPESSRLALWLMSANRKIEAVALLNDQLAKNPDNEIVLADAITIYLNLGDKEKAGTCLDRLERLYPLNQEAKVAKGLLFEMNGNLREALAIYEELFRGGNKALSVIKYITRIYLRENRWDKAILNIRSALDNYPNEPELLEGLGRLLISSQDTKLINVIEGREYSVRAYIHFKSSPEIKIAAARNLATAAAIKGEKQMASRFIHITLGMASKVKTPQEDYASYFDILKKQYAIPE